MRADCYKWGLIVLLVPIFAGAADDTKPRQDPGAAPDVQDVIFFGKTRPVMIRMHILTDGRPFSLAWDRFVEKLFQYTDKNGDGKLDEDEAKRLIPAAQMQQLVRGNFYAFYNQGTVAFNQVDEDADGKVTLDELKAFYNSKAQVAAMTIQPGYSNFGGQPGGNQLTTSLLKHLGGKDGKLDLKKLINTDDLVVRLDANDDETLDVTELSTPNLLGGGQPGGVMVMPGRGRPGVLTGESSIFLVPKETGAAKLSERLNLSKELLTRYDKDKSNKLTREEIGLDLESFNNLDRNGDSLLDSVELLRYFVVSPDLEVTAKFGKRDNADKDGPALQLTPGKKSGLETSVKQASGDTLMLTLSTIQMELKSAAAQAAYMQPRNQTKQYYDQLFNTADMGKKGVIEIEQVKKMANLQYMKGLFEMSDRDGDGKVTKQEYDDFLEMQAGAFGTTMSLTVNETSRGLFELLDTNRDGRLSVRELRMAGEKLAAYDLNADGILSEEEIPVQVQVSLSSGSQPNYQVRNLYQPGVAQRPVATAGPIWFRKMDRNGDGDISKREFLGSPAEFKKLDVNEDGYISLEEAQVVDAMLRGKK